MVVHKRNGLWVYQNMICHSCSGTVKRTGFGKKTHTCFECKKIDRRIRAKNKKAQLRVDKTAKHAMLPVVLLIATEAP